MSAPPTDLDEDGGQEHGGPRNDTLTAVSGVMVGHWTQAEARTGCTVVVLPAEGAVASGAVLGAAPGTRETALLAPEKSVQRVHAFVLTGGSAFGLATADGVVRGLEARGIGHPTPAGPVPIVPTAALFDLMVGDPSTRPGADEGGAALADADVGPVRQGAIGAGAGATVGKLAGFALAEPSGLGSALVRLGGARVGALAVSNAAGDIVDPSDGRIIAGAGFGSDPERVAALFTPASRSCSGPRATALSGANTTLVVVVTDAPLSKAAARALADAAHVGIARVTRPSHTVVDGDTTFVASTGRGPDVDLAALGVAVQNVVAEAIVRGVRAVREADRAGSEEGRAG